jgi:hypothetical protein
MVIILALEKPTGTPAFRTTNMIINLDFKPSRLLGVFAGWLCLWLAWNMAAQPVIFTYDPDGNPITASVGVSMNPSITTPPQAELLQSNSLAAFSVTASGAGLSYQWLSNGVPIMGATGDTLLLAGLPLTGTNLGNFSVIVSNASGSITSAPAALWPDVNGNGIPDWWEMKYFGNLNQPALGDYDGDGVDNLDEYLEGTNPTNSSSFNPRLSVQASYGYVTVSPDQPYYTLGQVVTLTAVPDPGQEFVNWSGAATGTKAVISLFMNTNEFVTANFGFPLGVALDNTNLVWTTSGDELWFGEAEVSEDGVSAAQSGPIVSYSLDPTQGPFVGDQTSLQTTFYISQPEQLGFWWDVSSQPPDGVTFAINGVTVAALSGEAVPWQQIQTNLPAGVYTLTWTYSKGPVNIPDGIPYVDAAWVDEVSLEASAASPAPVLGIQLSGENAALLYWPVSTSVFRLQQTAALNPASWTDTTNTVNPVNGTNQVLLAPTAPTQFYRLVYVNLHRRQNA